jgi:hypothetical protein
MQKKEYNAQNFINYFQELGYQVIPNGNSRLGENWFDIEEKGELICQIDQNVPIEVVVADLISLHLGVDAKSDFPDYKICGPDSDELKTLCKKIYERENVKRV